MLIVLLIVISGYKSWKCDIQQPCNSWSRFKCEWSSWVSYWRKRRWLFWNWFATSRFAQIEEATRLWNWEDTFCDHHSKGKMIHFVKVYIFPNFYECKMTQGFIKCYQDSNTIKWKPGVINEVYTILASHSTSFIRGNISKQERDVC